jgi:hypothetical protein
VNPESHVESRGESVMAAVRGPILLITLGVLLALDQTDRVSFWRTWPVLLILFGVFKLAERGGRSA